MSRIRTAIEQMAFARRYTLALLDTVPADQWFTMPQPGTTHVAWQVGHLAMAQYRLCLERWRGVRPEDEALISTPFLNLFLRDSVPDADATVYPATADIRAVFDRVYDHTMTAVAGYDEAEFDLPVRTPHKLCTTRGECLFWASAHEMLHAGQIGLLRRMLGHRPVWQIPVLPIVAVETPVLWSPRTPFPEGRSWSRNLFPRSHFSASR